MDNIKTYEGFLQDLKDYWKSATVIEQRISKEEIVAFCTDALIDLEDNNLSIVYKVSDGGIEFSHSGNYTDSKKEFFTIEIESNDDMFILERIKSEILFVIDLLKTEYTFDDVKIKFDQVVSDVKKEFDFLDTKQRFISLNDFEKNEHNINIESIKFAFTNIKKIKN